MFFSNVFQPQSGCIKCVNNIRVINVFAIIHFDKTALVCASKTYFTILHTCTGIFTIINYSYFILFFKNNYTIKTITAIFNQNISCIRNNLYNFFNVYLYLLANLYKLQVEYQLNSINCVGKFNEYKKIIKNNYSITN